jgi:hypothetical protein
MRLKRRSPSLVISLIALVMAMSGTAIAAVNFASNAGPVDGKSAVADGALRSQAAGGLVATQRSGDAKGTIRAKYSTCAASCTARRARSVSRST